jgi:hypothetical protein
MWSILSEAAGARGTSKVRLEGTVSMGQLYSCLAGFEVLTATDMKMAVFRVVAPYSLIVVYRRFRDTCCLHHHGADHRPDEGGRKRL